MVKPFQDAVFSVPRTGLLNKVVETEFGYHIIDVTHTSTSKQYKVATIERTITPSDETQDKVFRRAPIRIMTNLIKALNLIRYLLGSPQIFDKRKLIFLGWGVQDKSLGGCLMMRARMKCPKYLNWKGNMLWS